MNRLAALLIGIFMSQGALADSSNIMNLRFDPLGLLIGIASLDLDVKLADNWTLGPTIKYWRLSVSGSGTVTSNFSVSAFAVGGRANWFANGVYRDGLYVGPSIQFGSATVTATDVDGERRATASGLFAQALVGYGWFWDSFNILLGGGFNLPLGNAKAEYKDSSGSVEEVTTLRSRLALEFSLGWTF